MKTKTKPTALGIALARHLSVLIVAISMVAAFHLRDHGRTFAVLQGLSLIFTYAFGYFAARRAK